MFNYVTGCAMDESGTFIAVTCETAESDFSNAIDTDAKSIIKDVASAANTANSVKGTVEGIKKSWEAIQEGSTEGPSAPDSLLEKINESGIFSVDEKSKAGEILEVIKIDAITAGFTLFK